MHEQKATLCSCLPVRPGGTETPSYLKVLYNITSFQRTNKSFTCTTIITLGTSNDIIIKLQLHLSIRNVLTYQQETCKHLLLLENGQALEQDPMSTVPEQHQAAVLRATHTTTIVQHNYKCTRQSSFTSDNGVSTPQNHVSMLQRVPNTRKWDFLDIIKFHVAVHMLWEKAIQLRHPNYDLDRAQKLISSSMSNICRHATFHPNLAHRQTNERGCTHENIYLLCCQR